MGISCKSWGKMRSIEKKLERSELMSFTQKIAAKPSQQGTKKAPKEKAAKKK